ncbi:hypothetical protein [Foetidibacter luteolus]|uniref:hypothetical protein n=1 Tax=Foetidibacter luteolus TaxID=2608880 RepID=UPI00129B851C|nr:hypothetical protein [Foetidibacter luteolus]
MENQLQYKTVLLQTLVQLLRNEGLEISTAAALDIGRILMRASEEDCSSFARLKYLLTPVISRNKEEQEKVHKIFNLLDEKVILDDKAIVQVYDEVKEQETKEQVASKLQQWWYALKAKPFKPIAAVVILTAIIIWGIKLFSPGAVQHGPPRIVVNKAEMLVNDTILFSAVTVDSSLKESHTAYWQFGNGATAAGWQAPYRFEDTGKQVVAVYVKNKAGAVIDSARESYTVLAELPVKLTIQTTELVSQDTRLRTVEYSPVFFNATADTSQYRYNWYKDGVLQGNGKQFTLSAGRNKPLTVKLTVDYNSLHLEDSVVYRAETPAIAMALSPLATLQIPVVFNWKNIVLSLLFILTIPIIAGLLLYAFLSKRIKPASPGIELEPGGDEEPYEIKFQQTSHLIHPSPAIEHLADNMRKRQVSDLFKLNIRKTILSVFKTGGLPQLQFSPLTRPTEFLVFIDNQHPGSFLFQLFNTLCEKLLAEQVNITVYEYYKEPLYLTSHKLNQVRIPVERVAALYPNTALIIFGDAANFFQPLKNNPRPWLKDRFEIWETKILVTPFAKNDWDKREKILTSLNFMVLPADADAFPVIERIINRQVDVQAQHKLQVPETYEARFLQFNTLQSLEQYLGNRYLLQWVCSLAVYPVPDWNLTLAIGHALEKMWAGKGKTLSLVNYSNLLKLARISWLHDGVISGTIKTLLLQHLEKEVQLTARRVLLEQLHAIRDSISPGSLIRRHFDVQEAVNNFILKASEQQPHTREELRMIREILEHQQLDLAVADNLSQRENDMLVNPGSGETMPLKDYLQFAEDEITGEHKKRKRKAVIYSVACGIFYAAAAWFSLANYSNWLQWKNTLPVNLSFIVSNNVESSGALKAGFIVAGDTLGFAVNNGDTVLLRNVTVTDTAAVVPFTLQTGEGREVARDSFRLNASLYNLQLSQPSVVAVTMHYNSTAAQQLAGIIAETLPARFRVNSIPENFSDTGIRIIYHNDIQLQDAQELAANISRDLGRNIQPVLAAGNAQQLNVYIAVNTCTQLAINALPASLNEIWHGGTSNRLVNINLQQRRIYYSTGDVSTYGTYNISEICFSRNMYKITIRTSQGYRLCFVRNVTAQSFELSVCQNPYTTKAEADNVTEANCDRFNRMTWYYPANNNVIYLPVSGTTLAPSENNKFQDKAFRMDRSGKFKATIHSATNFISPVSKTTVGDILSDKGFNIRVSRGNIPLDIEDGTPAPNNPFQRSYFELVIGLQPDENATTAAESNNPAEPVKNPDPKPDCNRVFKSLDEAKKEGSLLVICKLDLSANPPSTLPAEFYQLKNLQELNLGATSLYDAEISRLQEALPNCKIVYTRAASPAAQEILLGTIELDKKLQPDKRSLDLINTTAQQLNSQADKKIRLEATYNTESERLELQSILNNISNIFYKSGVRQVAGQITNRLVPAQQQQSLQQQQQQQQQLKGGAQLPYTIRIIGINFTDAGAKSATTY